MHSSSQILGSALFGGNLIPVRHALAWIYLIQLIIVMLQDLGGCWQVLLRMINVTNGVRPLSYKLRQTLGMIMSHCDRLLFTPPGIQVTAVAFCPLLCLLPLCKMGDAVGAARPPGGACLKAVLNN